LDVTPLVPKDRQVIESYSAQGFRISGVFHAGPVLVLPAATYPWTATTIGEISLENLAPVIAAGAQILLLGCGERMALVPEALRRALRERGVVIDAMDTGAACRTYNILLAEDRRVAAALLPGAQIR
jgi:uncharacterized protein